MHDHVDPFPALVKHLKVQLSLAEAYLGHNCASLCASGARSGRDQLPSVRARVVIAVKAGKRAIKIEISKTGSDSVERLQLPQTEERRGHIPAFIQAPSL